MDYGHLHHVILEQRSNQTYITFIYATGLREGCEIRKIRGETVVGGAPVPTDVVGTPVVVAALNAGDARFLRSDDAAREIRLALFAFLQQHAPEDPRYAIIADDLRRHATNALCASGA